MVSVTADLLPAGLIPAGTHVCWVFGHPDDYVSAAVPLLAEAKRLEQQPVLIAPPGSAGLAALEPFAAGAMRLGGTPPDPMVIAGLIREQAALAQAGGYRGVRLVADMNVLHPAGPAAIAACEAALDHAAAELDATIICAYQQPPSPPHAIEAALALHPVLRGHDADPPFRFTCTGAGQWQLSGEVGFTASPLLAAALNAAARLGTRDIDLGQLTFIDISGIRAITTSAAASTGTGITLHNPPPVFQRYWQLCGYTHHPPGIHLATAPAR